MRVNRATAVATAVAVLVGVTTTSAVMMGIRRPTTAAQPNHEVLVLEQSASDGTWHVPPVDVSTPIARRAPTDKCTPLSDNKLSFYAPFEDFHVEGYTQGNWFCWGVRPGPPNTGDGRDIEI